MYIRIYRSMIDVEPHNYRVLVLSLFEKGKGLTSH